MTKLISKKAMIEALRQAIRENPEKNKSALASEIKISNSTITMLLDKQYRYTPGSLTRYRFSVWLEKRAIDKAKG